MTHELIDMLGAALEIAGVALLIGGLVFAFARSIVPSAAKTVRIEPVRPEPVEGQRVAQGFLRQAQDDRSQDPSTSSGRTGTGERAAHGAARYRRLRHDIGRAILLGLEVLVAADIVRSVALAPSMGGLTVLATLVVIRTFLSWSLALELDGRWPWQRPASPQPETTP
jgi:Protein of unknown function (DUF1622)